MKMRGQRQAACLLGAACLTVIFALCPVRADASLSNGIITALIWPEVTEAINAFYSEYISGGVTIAPYFGTKIVRVEGHPYRYTVTIEVEPYIGAHIPVGQDRVAVNVSLYEVKVHGLSHIKSFEINHPYLKGRILKPLP